MELTNYLMKEFKKRKIDDAIISHILHDIRRIKFADNKIVNTTTESLQNINLFLVKDKKILSTNFKENAGGDGKMGGISRLEKKQADNFVMITMKRLKSIKSTENYYGINEKKFRYSEIKDGYDKKVKNINDLDLLGKGMNSALKIGAKRTNGVLEIHDAKGYVETSNNVEYKEKKSEFYFSIRSFFGKEESGHMNCCSRTLKKFNIEKAGRESGEIAKDSRNPVNCKSGKYDLIMSPMAFAPILMYVGEAASIFAVESGLSFFSDKIDKKVGSNELVIYDDGTLANGIGSTKADAEGVKTRKNILIDEGIFRKYLHNTSTARKYKTESTGNAGMIYPEPWNVAIKTGKENSNEMIKDIKRGIYITNVWYTRFTNYHTGDFSTIPRDGAFLIKNGKIIQSLKGMRISENVLKMLANIDSIGNKPVNLRTWEAEMPVYTPAVLIRNCNITTPIL
ncbi:TldD/PmbA family protein [Candidatus Woesearchaeota archaeon]|nr:TldD/PmbA family protein [Candidatus Woesearchaeota archaeon]